MSPEMPATSVNVQKVMEAFLKDPKLLKEMNQVLAKVCEKAGVTLTQTEKAEVLSSLASMISIGPSWVVP